MRISNVSDNSTLFKSNQKVVVATSALKKSLQISESFVKNKKFFNLANEEVSNVKLIRNILFNSDGEPFNGYFEQIISDKKKVRVDYVKGLLFKSYINDKLYREFSYGSNYGENVLNVTDFCNQGTKTYSKTFSHYPDGKIKCVKTRVHNRNYYPTPFVEPRAVETRYKHFNEKGDLLEEMEVGNVTSDFEYCLYNPETKTKEILKWFPCGEDGSVRILYRPNPFYRTAYSHLVEKGFYKDLTKEDAKRTLELMDNASKYVERCPKLDHSIITQLKIIIGKKYGI